MGFEMWKTACGFLISLCLPLAASAQQPGFDSPECRLMAMKISETTASVLTGVVGTHKIAQFAHPFAGEGGFTFYCEAGFLAKLSFYDKTIAPSAQWYALVSTVSDAIGLNGNAVEAAAKDCMHQAVQSKDQTAKKVIDRQLYRCTTLTDPPSNSLTLYSYTPEGKALYAPD